MTVRVVIGMITRNSNTKLRDVKPFRLMLDSIWNAFPRDAVRAFILADDSDDDTPRIVREFCSEHGLELVQGRGFGTRAVARQWVIDTFLQNFSEEWLFFMDDDVELSSGLYQEFLQVCNDPSIGLAWGIDRPAVFTFIYGLAKALGKKVDDLLISEFKKRGGTHDTFLRRRAIEGIKIPEELHEYEDWYIKKYVESRGYRCAILRSGCLHYNPGFFSERKAVLGLERVRRIAYLASKYGVEKPSILRLLRSISGLPVNILGGIYAFELKHGLKVGIGRWLDKVLFRIYLIYWAYRLGRTRG